jgi:4-oxalocrotonate tautomerase
VVSIPKTVLLFSSIRARALASDLISTTNGRWNMPLIQVKVIEGVFSKEQKREIVKRLTDAMVSIEGEGLRQFTLCIVEEVKSGDWGIGGKPLTTADVKALAAGKAKG